MWVVSKIWVQSSFVILNQMGLFKKTYWFLSIQDIDGKILKRISGCTYKQLRTYPLFSRYQTSVFDNKVQLYILICSSVWSCRFLRPILDQSRVCYPSMGRTKIPICWLQGHQINISRYKEVIFKEFISWKFNAFSIMLFEVPWVINL